MELWNVWKLPSFPLINAFTLTFDAAHIHLLITTCRPWLGPLELRFSNFSQLPRNHWSSREFVSSLHIHHILHFPSRYFLIFLFIICLGNVLFFLIFVISFTDNSISTCVSRVNSLQHLSLCNKKVLRYR